MARFFSKIRFLMILYVNIEILVTFGYGAVFSLGKPKMFGSGCPDGSVEVITSADGQTVTVLFSQYSAQTNYKKTFDRASCNLAIPVDVENGSSVGVFSVDYRGFTSVPSASGSYSKFSAEYFFAGADGPKEQKEFQNYYGDFSIVDNMYGAVTYSDCSPSVIFRINTSISAAKKSLQSEDVLIQVDSTDTKVEQSFRYEIVTEPCY